jgi:hypothetical protein
MSQSAKTLNYECCDAEAEIATRVAEASVMLDLFYGLDVRSFALTILDEAGQKVAFRPSVSIRALRAQLPSLLTDSNQRQLNVIVRPISPSTLTFVQLDDLSPLQLDSVYAFSFLVLETSPGNFQAWLAVRDAGPHTIRRIKKAVGADPAASGATRLAGSYNFKPKYRHNYPRVRLQAVAPRRTVTIAELSHQGLLSPDDARPPATPGHPPDIRPRLRGLVWPSYARCLSDAPRARNHEGKDRSAADFNFCLISIDRGWSVKATADQLMTQSGKARIMGYNYALFTAKRAAFIVTKNRP